MKKNIGVVELSKELNLSIATIGNYCKKGMPHSEKYSGVRKVRTFNLEECKEWMKGERK